jgi:hypothetical protein
MSTMDADDFVTDSTPPLDAATSPASESVGAHAASVTAHEPEGTADATPATDPETHETPVAERERGADGKFKRNAIQERIDKAVAQQRAAEREAAALRAEVEAYRTRTQAAPPASPDQPAAPSYDATKGPELAEFNSYEEWVDARAEWKAEQKWQRIQADAAERAAKQAHERTIATHTERIAAFAAKTPDYFDKIQEARSLPVSVAMEAAIIASDHGPAIAYFLATHPEEGAQLAYETQGLDASAAAVVRRLLESKVNASQTASSGPVAGGYRPNVPAPIKPVGSAPVVADPPLDSLDVDAFIARENAREHNERKARLGVK